MARPADPSSIVQAGIGILRAGDRDTAFFALINSGCNLLPSLTDHFRSEQDPDVRAFLIEVLWQQRDMAAIEVLGEALYDRDPRVWKEALNGLVTLASPQSVGTMNRARSRGFDTQDSAREFLVCLAEALEQTEAAMGMPK